MNWKQLLANIAGAALAGAASAAASSPTGVLNWKMLLAGAGVSAAGTVVGLFQTPPHQGA